MHNKSTVGDTCIPSADYTVASATLPNSVKNLMLQFDIQTKYLVDLNKKGEHKNGYRHNSLVNDIFVRTWEPFPAYYTPTDTKYDTKNYFDKGIDPRYYRVYPSYVDQTYNQENDPD